jgi:ribulose-phosphate 3-epimerase
LSATKVVIAPSVLAADFTRLGQQLAEAQKGGADWFHLDVMDGHFVPNISFGPPVIASIRRASSLPLDVHLMISDPDRHLESFRTAGADLITVHQETCPHLHRTLSRIRELGARTGVALNPATPASTLERVLPFVDLVLVMTVNPGFGGQKFIADMTSKIAAVRAMIEDSGKAIHLEVDGGIDPTTAGTVVAAGADVLVAGTAIFRAASIGDAISAIRQKGRPMPGAIA